MNTLLVAADSAAAEVPAAATAGAGDWRRDMSVGHRLPGGRMIVHAPGALWCDLCEHAVAASPSPGPARGGARHLIRRLMTARPGHRDHGQGRWRAGRVR